VISSSQRPLPDNTRHSQQTNIHAPVGFEPTISAGERPQTYALDSAATGTGMKFYCFLQILLVPFYIIVYMVVCFVCFYLILYIRYSYCYVCSVLGIVFLCVVLCIVCVQMCTAVQPPRVNPIVINKYIISYNLFFQHPYFSYGNLFQRK